MPDVLLVVGTAIAHRARLAHARKRGRAGVDVDLFMSELLDLGAAALQGSVSPETEALLRGAELVRLAAR